MQQYPVPPEGMGSHVGGSFVAPHAAKGSRGSQGGLSFEQGRYVTLDLLHVVSLCARVPAPGWQFVELQKVQHVDEGPGATSSAEDHPV